MLLCTFCPPWECTPSQYISWAAFSTAPSLPVWHCQQNSSPSSKSCWRNWSDSHSQHSHKAQWSYEKPQFQSNPEEVDSTHASVNCLKLTKCWATNANHQKKVLRWVLLWWDPYSQRTPLSRKICFRLHILHFWESSCFTYECSNNCWLHLSSDLVWTFSINQHCVLTGFLSNAKFSPSEAQNLNWEMTDKYLWFLKQELILNTLLSSLKVENKM